jgi:hypothetical protein
MAQWNKLATSGSNVQFNSVFAATSITASAVTASVTGSFKGDGSQLTNLPTATVLSSSVSIDTYNFNGDGSTKIFTLSQSYNVNSLLVSVDGLSQANITDYTLSSATLTFVDTPPSASNILIKAFTNVTQNVTGSFSGSFFGIIASASYAVTASYAANGGTSIPAGTVSSSGQVSYTGLTSIPSGIVSSSAQVTTLLPSGTVSSSAQTITYISNQLISPAGVSSSNDITPTTDNSYNLGAVNKRWANIYTGDLNLSNEGSSGNIIDGTTGNWTIQEGMNSLYILNNKNGKKFKIMLEEIE